MVAEKIEPRRGAERVGAAESKLQGRPQLNQVAIGDPSGVDLLMVEPYFANRLHRISFLVATNRGMVLRQVGQQRHLDRAARHGLAETHLVALADQKPAHRIDP